MPILSVNLLSIAQLKQTKKIVEFWLDLFIVKDPRLWGVRTVASGYLNPKDKFYKFRDYPMNVFWVTGSIALIAQTYDISQILHE